MCRTVQWYFIWRKHPMKTQNKMARRIFMHVYYMLSSEMILRLFHTECVHHVPVMLAVALLVQDCWVGFATICHCSGSRQTQQQSLLDLVTVMLSWRRVADMCVQSVCCVEMMKHRPAALSSLHCHFLYVVRQQLVLLCKGVGHRHIFI